MEFLKRNPLYCVILSCCLLSCGPQEGDTITEIIKLRSDTYISSNSDKDHSEYDYLKISKSETLEERILLRLPTNDYDDNFFDDCFDDSSNLCNVFLMPIAITLKILTTDCDDLDAANLTSAILALDTEDSSDITAGSLEINLLDKPWWHMTTWKRAHPFAKDGKWKNSGGDVDSEWSFEANCTNLSSGSCGTGEVKFEMTDFFRDHLEESQKHYGMIISANTTLSSKKLVSVQGGGSRAPRIIAQYTCNTKGILQTKVFYFGSTL